MTEPFSSYEDFKDLKGLHLFHAQSSNCSMRARVLLAEKSLDYVTHMINVSAQENLHPKYLQIHPDGLVPALVHDGKAVPGSDNILLYLEEQFPNPSFSPSDNSDVEIMKQWVHRAAAFHMNAVKTYTYSRRKTVNKSGLEMSAYANLVQDPALVDFHTQSLEGFNNATILKSDRLVHQTFENLNMQLSGRDWIMGAQFTLADIAWSTPHLTLGRAGFTLESFPNVQRWVKRLEQRKVYIDQMLFMLA